MSSLKKKGEPKKRKRGMQTKIIPVFTEDISPEEEEEDEGGMFLEKEEIKLIYNALNVYKATEAEEHLHSVLVEEFEVILLVDYGEPYTDSN